MGEREGDDLAGVGWVGQGFLIAGHAGVEADLADGGGWAGMGAEAAAPEDRAIGQDQGRSGPRRGLVGVGELGADRRSR